MPDADILIHSGDVAKAWTWHRRFRDGPVTDRRGLPHLKL